VFDGSIALLKVMPESITAGAEGLKALYEPVKSAQ
jgi:deferrochelatase/peroxidase EfeB